MSTATQRKIYESNCDTVRIQTTQGELIARIHPSDIHDDKHKICYSSDDYVYINDGDVISFSPMTFKKTRTKKGIWYQNIGTSMKLSYEISTTKKDEDANNDYSNVLKRRCDNLEEVFYIFNAWQREGYKNIGIQTVITHDDETIIEDSAVNLEVVINSKAMSGFYKDEREHDLLCKKLEMYEAFTEQFKAEKLFEKFEEEYK